MASLEQLLEAGGAPPAEGGKVAYEHPLVERCGVGGKLRSMIFLAVPVHVQDVKRFVAFAVGAASTCPSLPVSLWKPSPFS